ncbi:HAMP domain-containing sensor histidine kinase [Lysinibacillus louembei]|uniref:histidine kinase n=1 Tax=Lysinibacillus louembei TaxID=1470088 RepID=A0ABZ0S4R6_9BACI|nr:HAMP domain-containing sensor histidine kinase [Lysinibacillus louembei]WPK12767.1 HAMP domain-containing sensor histidine kinase [Lysinibacillus louembei]
MEGIKIQTFFLRYLLLLTLGTILLALLLAGLFSLAFSTNIVLPANYTEWQISQLKGQLSSSEVITEDMIPPLADYAIVSKDGHFLSGSLSPQETLEAQQLIDKGKRGQGQYFYSVIERASELCIIRYRISPEYSSPLLRAYLPNIELLSIIVFIVGIIALTATIAIHFGKSLQHKMIGLQEAIEKIENQNLDFDISPSGIQEIDGVALSLEQMKNALSHSLQQQWHHEHMRREQIAALAHDLKTPITIIKGNAELLQGTAQDAEQQAYNQYILKNTQTIEQFTQQLIDLSNMDTHMLEEKADIDTELFIEELEQQMLALATKKSIAVNVQRKSLPAVIHANAKLLQRAISNIISNAMEHTPPNGQVMLTIATNNVALVLTITDSGSGFSPQDLQEAMKQFYQGDQSRNNNNHHGMGLYIAATIIKQHQGQIKLANNACTSGAEVTVTIPI